MKFQTMLQVSTLSSHFYTAFALPVLVDGETNVQVGRWDGALL
jgi:hypothetical protein